MKILGSFQFMMSATKIKSFTTALSESDRWSSFIISWAFSIVPVTLKPSTTNGYKPCFSNMVLLYHGFFRAIFCSIDRLQSAFLFHYSRGHRLIIILEKFIAYALLIKVNISRLCRQCFLEIYPKTLSSKI